MGLNREIKEKTIANFAIRAGDTGSSAVQVALLTENIKRLTEHCKVNKKDFSSKRGLLKMVCRRKAFLSYISKKDVGQYKELIQKLGSRK